MSALCGKAGVLASRVIGSNVVNHQVQSGWTGLCLDGNGGVHSAEKGEPNRKKTLLNWGRWAVFGLKWL